MDVRIRSTFFRLAKAKCFGPLFHLCLSRTLWIAFSPILSHYLCTNFPNGDTDKVNGCILVIFRRAKVASGPQMRDSLRLRHRRDHRRRARLFRRIPGHGRHGHSRNPSCRHLRTECARLRKRRSGKQGCAQSPSERRVRPSLYFLYSLHWGSFYSEGKKKEICSLRQCSVF